MNELAELLALFPGPTPDCTPVPPTDVPQPYQDLLVHTNHMTVTVEAHHGDRVDVQVLQRRLNGDTYDRKILLTLHETGRVVQFGVVRIHLGFCSDPVREAILAQKTPLGRILIENDVLRWIEPIGYFRVEPGPVLTDWFGPAATGRGTYGRVGVIHCDGQPAIEVLEIVAPE